MDRYLGRYAEYIYALLRIVSGFLFLQHGTQKFFDIPASGKPPVPMSAMIGAAAAIEIIAVLYCFLFLYIAARGSGALSVDASIGRRSGVQTVSESPPADVGP